MKILVADDISVLGIEKLQALPGATVIVRTGLTEAELTAELADTDALLVRSQTLVTEHALACAQRLRVIGRAGVGVDNIDVNAATARGVVVLNAPDGNTISAAEHTFAMLISLSRMIPQADRSVRSGRWDRKQFVGVELSGKKLAVLGMGRIGTEVAKRAAVFGMQVFGYDPFLTDARARELGVTRATLTEAIAVADFVTVHTPLTTDTHHLLNADMFARMRDGVRIVNCARGGIIDEVALAAALSSGRVAGAAIDVFEHEPLAADHPLLQFGTVIVTPHLGASTVEAQENVAIDVAEQVGRLLLGQPFHNAVNLPSLSAEQEAILHPYLELGEQLGLLAAQWVQGGVSQIEVHVFGSLALHDVSFLTRTVLKGFLGYRYGAEVNYVNAPLLASQAGVLVQETKQPQGRVFNTLLQLVITSESGTHRLSGTLYNGFGPRIVEIDGYTVDVAPGGNMLITNHIDRPGMIGRIGSLLGDAQVNIAGMQVGRRETGGEALMVLSVDRVVPPDIVARIVSMDGIRQVRAIDLLRGRRSL